MKVGIFNTAFVGDVALMGRLVDALFLDKHEIVLFSNAAGCKLYSCDPRVSEAVVVRKQSGVKKLVSISTIAQQIANAKLDVLLLAHNSFTSGLIALLSRVPKIVSFADGSPLRIFFEKSHATHHVHESERYLQLAQSLLSESAVQNSRLELHGDRTLGSFSRGCPDFFAAGKGKFFVCSPGSVWATKKYPARLLARVIGRVLSERDTLRCVLSGGPTDAADIDLVLSELRSHSEFASVCDSVVDARACLPLPELIELTRLAAFVLTPDSAPLHIGSATNTRTFAFFGPTPSNTSFFPLADNSRILDMRNLKGSALPCQPCSKHGQTVCPLRHHSCLADLPPDAVAMVVLQSLPKQ